MTKIFFSLLLTALFTGPLLAGQRYIIPHATKGSPVYLQNASDGVQIVKLFDQYVALSPMETYRTEAAAAGSIVIDSTAPILAWSAVDGVIFQAVAPASQVSMLVTQTTGLAFANDSSSQLDIKLDVYDGSQRVCGLSGAMAPGSSFAMWAGDLLKDLPEGEFTLVVSGGNGHLAVGAARLRNNQLETVPTGQQ